MNRSAGQAQKQARRKEILNAAIASFLHEGYGASSIDDVAKQAGVSKPTVYKHYDSKIDLFCAMIDHMVERVNGDDEGLEYALSLPPRDGLFFAANQMVERFYQEDLIKLYTLIIGERRQFPEMNEALAQCFCNSCHDHIEQLLTSYTEKNLANIDDVKAAANQFMVLLEEPVICRLFMRRDEFPGQKERNEIVRRTVGMFWKYYKK